MFVLIILSANTSNKMIEFFIKLHVSCLAGFIVELPHTKCAQQSPIALCWDGTKTVAKTYRISLSFSFLLFPSARHPPPPPLQTKPYDAIQKLVG